MTPADRIRALPQGRLLAEFSLWSADLIHMARDLDRIAPHADLLHVDVADGHFAPALLLFPDMVARIAAHSPVPVHVHLMCADAVILGQVDQFAEAGASLITLHVENEGVADAALDRIASHGIAGGLALRVETPVARAARWLPRTHMLTLLGTAIGVKGQGLDPAAGDRLREAGRLIEGAGRRVILAADGGIRETTVPLLRAAGAGTVVLGSLAFGAADLGAQMDWLRSV